MKIKNMINAIDNSIYEINKNNDNGSILRQFRKKTSRKESVTGALTERSAKKAIKPESSMPL